MIKTVFALAAVADVPGDFKERIVTVTDSVTGVTAPYGPYTKADLNAVNTDATPNPVKIETIADRLVVLSIEQKDFDTSGNFSVKTNTYTVVDKTPPAEPGDVVAIDVVELP